MEDEEVLRPAMPLTMADIEMMSIDELEERIVSLQSEIEQLRAVIDAKQAAKGAADTVFTS
jgi:uncharacterized small protein (DUF1192 family)